MFEQFKIQASCGEKETFLTRVLKSFDENYATWLAEVDKTITSSDDEQREVKAYLMWNQVLASPPFLLSVLFRSVSNFKWFVLLNKQGYPSKTGNELFEYVFRYAIQRLPGTIHFVHAIIERIIKFSQASVITCQYNISSDLEKGQVRRFFLFFLLTF